MFQKLTTQIVISNVRCHHVVKSESDRCEFPDALTQGTRIYAPGNLPLCLVEAGQAIGTVAPGIGAVVITHTEGSTRQS